MRAGVLLIALLASCASLAACHASPAVTGNTSNIDPARNHIAINARNEVLWNGAPLTLEQLKANLAATGKLAKEPELQFEPDPNAGYDISAKVLNVIKDSNVTKFGFVGNEKYVATGKD